MFKFFELLKDSIWPVSWKKVSSGSDFSENLPSAFRPGAKRHDYRVVNSRLIFDSLEDSDLGEYVCSSSNDYTKSLIKLVISEDEVTVLQMRTYNMLAAKKLKQASKKRWKSRKTIQIK